LFAFIPSESKVPVLRFFYSFKHTKSKLLQTQKLSRHHLHIALPTIKEKLINFKALIVYFSYAFIKNGVLRDNPPLTQHMLLTYHRYQEWIPTRGIPTIDSFSIASNFVGAIPCGCPYFAMDVDINRYDRIDWSHHIIKQNQHLPVA